MYVYRFVCVYSVVNCIIVNQTNGLLRLQAVVHIIYIPYLCALSEPTHNVVATVQIIIILLLSYIRTTRISPHIVCKYILFCSSASSCQYIWVNPIWFCQAYPVHCDFFIYSHHAREKSTSYSLCYYFVFCCSVASHCSADETYHLCSKLYYYTYLPQRFCVAIKRLALTNKILL